MSRTTFAGTLYTNKFTVPDSYGTTEFYAAVVNGGDLDGKVKGIYQQKDTGFEPIDPSLTLWSTVFNSETATDSISKTSSLSKAESSPTEVLTEWYTTEIKNFFNTQNLQDPNISTRISPIAPSGSLSPLNSGSLPRAFATPVVYGRGKIQNLSYPIDLDMEQDHLYVEKLEYLGSGNDRRRRNVTGGLQATRVTGASETILGRVILPMPKPRDVNQAEWGKSTLDSIQLALVGGAGRTLSAAGDLASGDLKGVMDSATSQFTGIEGLQQFFKESVVGGVRNLSATAIAGLLSSINTGNNVNANQLLARTTGNIVNPNAELLFNGPSLRQFDFTYIMIARSVDEAKEIRKIVRFFKEGLVPNYKDTSLLVTPNVFRLKYKRGLDELKTVNKFKDMALQRLDVDYAAGGEWAAYEDSHPIVMSINLGFGELEPIYKQDIEQFEEDDVAY